MALERRRESLIDLMVDLDATLTSQQRAAARRQLLALATKCRACGAARLTGAGTA